LDRQTDQQTGSLDFPRRKAEEKLRTQLERVQKLSERDIQDLVHGLGAHQLEQEKKQRSVYGAAPGRHRAKADERGAPKAYRDLELKVQERTQELIILNERLNGGIEERRRTEESLRVAYAENKQLQDRFQAENIYLHNVIDKEFNFGEIIGRSNALKYVFFKSNRWRPRTRRSSPWRDRHG